MDPTLENIIFLLVICVVVGLISLLVSCKLKVDAEQAFSSVLIVLCMLIASYFLITGRIGYVYGVALIPPWGQAVIVVICLIQLAIIIRYWLKQKKNKALKCDENSDEGSDESTAAQESPEDLENKK